METPSELLRRARGLADLTQQQVADQIGIDRSLLAGYETGRKTPSLRMLERLLDGSGFDLELTLRPQYVEPTPEDDYLELAKLSPADRAGLYKWGLLDFIAACQRAGIDAAFDGALAARMHGIPVELTVAEIIVPFGIDEGQLARIGVPVDEYGLATVNRLPKPGGRVSHHLTNYLGHLVVRPVGFTPSQVAIHLPVGGATVPVIPLPMLDPRHPLVGPAIERLRALANRDTPPLPALSAEPPEPAEPAEPPEPPEPPDAAPGG